MVFDDYMMWSVMRFKWRILVFCITKLIFSNCKWSPNAFDYKFIRFSHVMLSGHDQIALRSVVVNNSQRFTLRCFLSSVQDWNDLLIFPYRATDYITTGEFCSGFSDVTLYSCWTAAWESAHTHAGSYRYSLWCVLPTAPPRRFSVFSHHKEEMTDYRLLPEYISVCGLPGDQALRSALEECPDTSLDGTVSIFCSPEPPRLDQQGLFCAGWEHLKRQEL